MGMMQAVIRSGGKTTLNEVPPPEVRAVDDVLIRVEVAGICRTDLYAAEGRLPGPEPLILGHEFSGVVERVGEQVRKVTVGDRVAVMPWIECGTCRGCCSDFGTALRCLHPRMLGVDLDGAFAEYVVVPERNAYVVPPKLPATLAAYAEPIAASLAVLKAGFQPNARGLIYGDNRIAQLTLTLLKSQGFPDVVAYDPCISAYEVEDSSFDFVVETVATESALDFVLRAVRPGGKVVLKSRPCQPVALDLRAAVLKEVTFHAVNYAPFSSALDLAAGGGLELEDLLGPVYPLAAYQEAFAAASGREAKKVFLTLSHSNAS